MKELEFSQNLTKNRGRSYLYKKGKGFQNIKEETEQKIQELDIANPENIDKIDFYKSEM